MQNAIQSEGEVMGFSTMEFIMKHHFLAVWIYMKKNPTNTAKTLGVSRATVYRWKKKWDKHAEEIGSELSRSVQRKTGADQDSTESSSKAGAGAERKEVLPGGCK
jgi:uncharacterized protein YjcR